MSLFNLYILETQKGGFHILFIRLYRFNIARAVFWERFATLSRGNALALGATQLNYNLHKTQDQPA